MKKTRINVLIAAILVGTLMAGCSSKASMTSSEDSMMDTTPAAQSNSIVSYSDSEETTGTDSDSSSTKMSSDTNSSSADTKTFSDTNRSSLGTKTSSDTNSDSTGTKISSDTNGNSSSAKTFSDTNSSSSSGDSSSSKTSVPSSSQSSSELQITTDYSLNSEQPAAQISLNNSGILDTSDMFSTRDIAQTADLSSAKKITVSDGKTIDITEEGVYLISGTAKNCTIKVNAEKESKVQLVLDGVNITNDSAPAVYVVSADKCFVTTANSENTLKVTGSFSSDGDTNTDAVIFSKDDLVLNGTGTLNIVSSENGISSKDDLKITGGTYNITSTADAVEAKDSIRICGGTFSITTSKDAFHSENDEDDTQGYIYISDGSFTINAASDAVQAVTAVQIDGGTFTLTAAEGIEATYVQINDGTINITASDDGINGAQKSRSYSTPTIEINGGNITIVMGQGDTDGIDSNGNILVNGGTINITAQMSSFDYDGTAEYNGGTIIINGSQVNSIPQSMMGGGFNFRGNRGF